jgi:hypothetical protein
MRGKKTVFFLTATALALLGATTRFEDAAHSMGLLSLRGGKVRHPPVFAAGGDRYTLIATATVLPPFSGDVRVLLEGAPEMEYALYNSQPGFDLGLRPHPTFQDGVYYGVKPGDRIALWVVMKPGEGVADGQAHEHPGVSLAFYESAGRKELLRIPIDFRKDGERGHAGESH